jgi:hypothetical protein
MKRYIGFALLIGLIFVLSACVSPEDYAKRTTCSQIKVIPVMDLNGNLITKFVSGDLKSHYEYDSKERVYKRFPTNTNDWNVFYDNINVGITKANAQFADLYADTGLIHGMSLNNQGTKKGQPLDVTSDISYHPCPDSDDPNKTKWEWHDGIRINIRSCNDETRKEYYCTDTTVAKEVTYITVSTPGGSRVDYSFPTTWLDQIMRSSFVGDQKPLDFKPEFVTPDILLDKQAYSETIIRTLVGKGDDREIASFTLVVSDFQGRSELRPVIAKAMEVAAVQAGHPVAMTLKGLMSNGQYTVANITAHQNAIKVNGWMALTFGSISSRGGSLNWEENYSSWFEDVTRGSIYIVNP